MTLMWSLVEESLIFQVGDCGGDRRLTHGKHNPKNVNIILLKKVYRTDIMENDIVYVQTDYL